MNKIKIKISLFILLIALVGASVLGQKYLPTNQSNIAKNNLASDAIYMDLAGWESDHRPEGIVPYTEVIVIAEITQIGQSKWNTPAGKRPADWTFAKINESRIYTPFSFEVKKVIKGHITTKKNHQFAVIGGTVEADVLNASTVDIYGDLQVGDQALLFLGKSVGNMAHISPYTYGDALRLAGDQLVAGCKQSRQVTDCRNVFNLSDYLNRIEQAK